MMNKNQITVVYGENPRGDGRDTAGAIKTGDSATAGSDD